MRRSDQENGWEKDFMGLGRDTDSCMEARKHVYASSHNVHGECTHTRMNNHIYNLDPNVSSQQYPDAVAVVKFNVLDDVRRPTPSRWLYDNNLRNSLAKGSLAFTAMRRSDWSSTRGSRQQFCSLNSTQEQRLGERVNDAYQIMHARGHENAALGSTGMNCNLPTNSLPDHSGSGMTVFPFVTPVLPGQASMVKVHQIPTVSTRAPTPMLVAGGHSTRVLPADSSIKPSSTQLTIFYAGKVNTYDDVSLNKAQEIMLMATAGNSLPLNMDMFSGKSIPMVTPPAPGSLINADALEFSQKDLPTSHSEQLARDQVGIGTLSVSIPQASHAEESSLQDTERANLDNEPAVPRALPQARKASLARFLERRRERVLSKSPYPVEKTFL